MRTYSLQESRGWLLTPRNPDMLTYNLHRSRVWLPTRPREPVHADLQLAMKPRVAAHTAKSSIYIRTNNLQGTLKRDIRTNSLQISRGWLPTRPQVSKFAGPATASVLAARFHSKHTFSASIAATEYLRGLPPGHTAASNI